MDVDNVRRRLERILRGVYHYSGIRAVWEKVVPPKEETFPKPATFVLWAIGIYFAAAGVATTRYENRVDIIENRANTIITQLSTPNWKNAFGMFARVQGMPCPQKPNIKSPITVLSSLFGSDTVYTEVVEPLKETAVTWRDSLSNVDLSHSDLSHTNLQGVDLSYSDLIGANLSEANFTVANLSKANFLNANFSRAELEGVDFSYAELRGATLFGANLMEADLSYANLEGADLRYAILSSSNLTEAEIYQAAVNGTTLGDARGMSWEFMWDAIIDSTTALPDYLGPRPED